MFLFVLQPFIFFNLKIIKEDIRRRYQCQIAQDTPMPGHENYAGIGITLKKKKKKKEDPFLTFVAQVVPPPRGVYPLIYHDP